MRTRRIVPPGDAHAVALRCYDFVTPWIDSRNHHAVIDTIAAILGIKIRPADNVQNGYVYCENYDNVPATQIVIALYEPCNNVACTAGHGEVKAPTGEILKPAVLYQRVPDITEDKIAAILTTIGEHPDYRIGADPEAITRMRQKA